MTLACLYSAVNPLAGKRSRPSARNDALPVIDVLAPDSTPGRTVARTRKPDRHV